MTLEDYESRNLAATARLGGMCGCLVSVTGLPRFVCTRDAGHDGEHVACTSDGEVLLSWPQRSGEDR